MSASEVDDFFQEYVFGFIFTDVRREIELAKEQADPKERDSERPPGGGNFLAALGLLCYTEVLGGIRNRSLDTARVNFDTFFREMGPEYERLLGSGFKPYRFFRCGMAHAYLPKGKAEMSILDNGLNCGIGTLPDGRYYFNVERYFTDFAQASRQLHSDLMKDPAPALPPELAGR